MDISIEIAVEIFEGLTAEEQDQILAILKAMVHGEG